ncbi:tRNA glutamyl-Q(34) synthetase GluQRS [Acuticoccus sp.]|uniref:tRNA glutamyl-Q(34) synthetase GluQRS n=1 Tax=Acuticoccus sp. TaxID=1904378 RepID=UPI003B51B67D
MLRFAPSPNGPLHLGHALSALANERMAAAVGRPLTLRMEDIDTARCRPQYTAAILADLEWLGIAWMPPLVRQSERFAHYHDALDALARRGLVAPSFATRREVADHARRVGVPRDPNGAPRFPGDAAVIGEAEAARRRRTGEPAAWRLVMARAAALTGEAGWTEVDEDGRNPRTVAGDALAWGDVILARKEVPTSYHLAAVVDDGADGATHVVRGADLFAATAVHRVLQRLLDLSAPLYRHHGLVFGPDGRKLSKSNGATSLAALREAGVGPDEVRRTALAAEVRAHLAAPTPRERC